MVFPNRLDTELRLGDSQGWQPATAFSYPDDDGNFANAVNRCVGVGKCRSLEGDVMCPSYRATRDEQHSTRGRSRLLFEMVRGTHRSTPGGAQQRCMTHYADVRVMPMWSWDSLQRRGFMLARSA